MMFSLVSRFHFFLGGSIHPRLIQCDWLRVNPQRFCCQNLDFVLRIRSDPKHPKSIRFRISELSEITHVYIYMGMNICQVSVYWGVLTYTPWLAGGLPDSRQHCLKPGKFERKIRSSMGLMALMVHGCSLSHNIYKLLGIIWLKRCYNSSLGDRSIVRQVDE